MKKIILIFLYWLFLTCQAFGANYFCDSTLGTGNDDGTTTDDAWQTLRKAFENSFSPGDKLWVRRVSIWDNDIEGDLDNIALTADGDAENRIYFIGWPRASKTINCDWINGSTTVNNVDSNDMDWEQHVGRWITGPDGFKYVLTHVIDSSTFVIDREYVGATASGQDVVIEEDMDYAEAQAIDDSAWTIKLSTWSADADDLPIFDSGNDGYRVYVYQATDIVIRNFHFKDGVGNQVGAFQTALSTGLELRNCNFTQTKPVAIGYLSSADIFAYNCIWKGDAGAGGQNGGPQILNAALHIRDSALYGTASNCVHFVSGVLDMYNVNLGVEIATPGASLNIWRASGYIYGKDVKLGSGMDYTSAYFSCPVNFENYGKILNQNRTVFFNCILDTRIDVTTVTPNKKFSDHVFEASYLGKDFYHDDLDARDYSNKLYNYIVPQSVPKAYRIYIFNDTGQTLNDTSPNDLFLRCRYVEDYEDDTEYIYSEWKYSDEGPFADAADADDWDYVEVDAFTPADSTAYVECELCSSRRGNLDTGDIYIDPSMQYP